MWREANSVRAYKNYHLKNTDAVYAALELSYTQGLRIKCKKMNIYKKITYKIANFWGSLTDPSNIGDENDKRRGQEEKGKNRSHKREYQALR